MCKTNNVTNEFYNNNNIRTILMFFISTDLQKHNKQSNTDLGLQYELSSSKGLPFILQFFLWGTRDNV
jgi:hypothetical protein